MTSKEYVKILDDYLNNEQDIAINYLKKTGFEDHRIGIAYCTNDFYADVFSWHILNVLKTLPEQEKEDFINIMKKNNREGARWGYVKVPFLDELNKVIYGY